MTDVAMTFLGLFLMAGSLGSWFLFLRWLFGCCLVLLVLSPAWATTVIPGVAASVNQGEGWRAISTPVAAAVGDMVMVAPKGSATITYDDGCAVEVKPGAVATIAPLSPCAAGSEAQVIPPVWPAIGAGALLTGGVGAAIFVATDGKGQNCNGNSGNGKGGGACPVSH